MKISLKIQFSGQKSHIKAYFPMILKSKYEGKAFVKKMITITSSKDYNELSKSFRKLHPTIVIVCRNHCDHFPETTKIYLYFIAFLVKSPIYELPKTINL